MLPSKMVSNFKAAQNSGPSKSHDNVVLESGSYNNVKLSFEKRKRFFFRSVDTCMITGCFCNMFSWLFCFLDS